ncbi:MAG TPA: alkyl sulfatase dimerization domain-containing protein [Acidimicrobiales bacterium]|nr:alkyl sulfatase dimerization domain-containing protein [Acidimicrobiales bacterium]
MDDILATADRLWRGEVTTAELHPFSHVGGLVEVADGIAFCPSFANATCVSTDDGLLMVDTGSSVVAPMLHEDIRRWTDARLDTAVFSHGHIDHVFGVGIFEQEAAEKGWRPPRVVAHELLPARFDRYRRTAGFNQIINRRQFGFKDLVWPTEYRYPDETYATERTLDVGGTAFHLRHEKGETDDHTVTWIPRSRALCCGDLFIWASPNAGNPQKVQRYPAEWAAALRRMAALEPELLLPGHGLPVVGAERVQAALTDTARYLEHLVTATLAMMNEGARLSEILHTVGPPADLADRPYLQPVYDEPEFVVRNVWRQNGGWWDGNPASLKPASDAALATELTELVGGPGTLCERALALADEGGDDALRLACHLAELAWLAAPSDPAVREARRAVFTARAEAATSTMAKGVFRWAARESLGEAF